MTLLRTPGTVTHAIDVVVKRIGMAAAIEAVGGGSVHRIRDWTYDATTACPTIAQAIALDAAFLAAGGNHAPILDAYAARLDRTVEDHDPCRRALATELADTAREYGDAIAATTPLTQPGHSANDALRALVEIDQAEGKLAALKRRVRSFIKPGAGPGHRGGGK